MPKKQKNGEKLTIRITPELKALIDKAVKSWGNINASDFVRQAIYTKLLFLIVPEERRCSCGKVLTPEEIAGSQGWHCKKCWNEAMKEFQERDGDVTYIEAKKETGE